ncbi:hypothetical protein AMEX_G1491 [Astyanax mexicanus]|uniref:Gypsy retrotransposon integrase-like protein 1 n=1 Tax=Astyanax mexicanus TaxID=7994 RepID=A0A8T2MHY0_ASTMX|nr:hypothetical protein AMEX_G1491 [Astyanax mexicanus]
MDDILVFGKDQEIHDRNLNAVLQTVEKSGLKLNKDKCNFSKPEIRYFGHIISKEGIQPDMDKVKAITEMSSPTNITELRQMLGMVNYLGKFLPGLSTVLHPVTELLKKDTPWLWTELQQKAFERVKSMLTTAPVLSFYDIKKPTVVSADASSYGLGATLLQGDPGELRPIAFCSRTLTETEKRYSQIEKECLAGVWACERFLRYLRGMDSFLLQTDHKPLVPLINSYDLDQVPPRCQRLLMRLMAFNVVAVHVPGKQLVIADTLSRNPVDGQDLSDSEQEVTAHVSAITNSKPVSEQRMESIRNATMVDTVLQKVLAHIRCGWPDKMAKLSYSLQPYFGARAHLSELDGIILYQDRLVIPASQQEDVLQRIHEGHQGLTKCRERARMTVWWPAISKDIAQKVKSCEFCVENKPSYRREPLLTTTLPSGPWQKIAADLCEHGGKKYLIVVDYYSRFLEIVQVSCINSQHVIASFKSMFARWGIPLELVSDNGTQFVSAEFKAFQEKYGFAHTTSSPRYPQSNGAAERAVRTAKHILKQSDPHLALMCYRATPLSATGASPAQLMMGRQIRTSVPMLEKNLMPTPIDDAGIRWRDEKAKRAYQFFYNRRHSARPLPELNPGQRVKVKLDTEKSWKTPATVLSKSQEPRSYVIQTEDNTITRRNRRHLQPVPESHEAVHPQPPSGREEVVAEPCEQSDSQMPSPDQTPTLDTPSLTFKPASPQSVAVTSRGREIRLPARYRDA